VEKRRLEKDQREAKAAEKIRKAKEELTFGQYFKETYFPNAKANKKEWTWKREKSLFKLWISPVIGKIPLKNIMPINVEKIKRNMIKAGKSPRSINYALALIRQVYNSAKQNRIYSGDSPLVGVNKLQFDNKRYRFLTHAEADNLLDILKKKNKDIYEMAMLSLHCGLRAGEIFSLIWGDVNFDEKTIFIRDPKNKKNRFAFMTQDVNDILASRKIDKNNKLLYTNSKGNKLKEIPKKFREIIGQTELNNGVYDTRDKVVFHTLRHTYASWLVQNGVDLYTVKELMGHSTLAMTERYAHLAKENLKNAVKKLEDSMKTTTKEKHTQPEAVDVD
jgi:integrase